MSDLPMVIFENGSCSFKAEQTTSGKIEFYIENGYWAFITLDNEQVEQLHFFLGKHIEQLKKYKAMKEYLEILSQLLKDYDLQCFYSVSVTDTECLLQGRQNEHWCHDIAARLGITLEQHPSRSSWITGEKNGVVVLLT